VETAYGISTRVGVGGAVSPHTLLGVEIFALGSSELVLAEGSMPTDAESGGIAPVVIWYLGRSGLYMKGGVGLARGTFAVTPASGEAVTTNRTGLAYTFGLGFDVGVASWLALTAKLGTHVMAIGDVPVHGDVAVDIIATVYEAGIGIALR